MTITSITDDNALPEEITSLIGTTMAPGQVITKSYTVERTEAGTYPNSASVTVKDDENNPATDTDSESVTVTDVEPSVTIDKSVDKTTLAEPGGVFNFTITITNTSPESVTFELTDTQAGPWSGTLTAAGTAGATASFTYPITHSDAGSWDNTAKVTVTDNEGKTATASDSETVHVTDEMPTIDVTKVVTSDVVLNEPGGTFDYLIKVTNTCNEPVTLDLAERPAPGRRH